MRLGRCPDCGGKVSARADVCPSCGLSMIYVSPAVRVLMFCVRMAVVGFGAWLFWRFPSGAAAIVALILLVIALRVESPKSRRPTSRF